MRGTIPAMERVYTTPLLDKLGIRPGMRVALIDIDDEAIRPLIADRTSDVTEGWPEPDTDVVLLGADSIGAAGAAAETARPASGRTARSGSSRARARPRPCATSRSSAPRRRPASSTTRSPRSRRRTRRCASSSRSRSALAERGGVPSAHASRPDHRPARHPRRRAHVARAEDAPQVGRGARPGRQGGQDRGREGAGRDPGAGERQLVGRRRRPTRPEPPDRCRPPSASRLVVR